MRKFLQYVLVAALGLAVVGASTTAPVQAQVAMPSAYDKVARGVPAGGGYALLSTYTPILIKYVGGGTGGTVTVAAAGQITLSTGPVGASAVDTTTECPIAAPLGGIIDVTNAACDTLGEVVDYINMSPNWRAVILDGVRSDSSNNTLATLAETAANGTDGLALLADSTVSLNITRAFLPEGARKMKFYLDPASPSKQFIPNPFVNSQVAFFRAQSNFTGTGASSFDLVSEIPNYKAAATGATTPFVATSTIKTEWSETGAATTVDFTEDFSELGFFGPRDARLVARYKAATTFTAGKLFIAGQFFQYN